MTFLWSNQLSQSFWLIIHLKTSGPTLLTKAWKRLAREVGKGHKDNDEGCMFKIVENKVDIGKCRMSIDLEE